MIKKFLSLSKKKQIFCFVWIFHFVFLLALSFHHLFHKLEKPKQPIAVRTFKPLQEIKTPSKNPVSKRSSEKKPEKKKGPIPIKSDKMGKTPPKNSINEITEALEILKELEGATHNRPTISLPSLIKSEPQLSESTHPSYGQFIINYLEQNLALPEHGDVKIKIRIDRDGRVVESSIISSENGKNSNFLKNELPLLRFPCFNDFGIHEKELTFTLSFRSK